MDSISNPSYPSFQGGISPLCPFLDSITLVGDLIGHIHTRGLKEEEIAVLKQNQNTSRVPCLAMTTRF